MAYRIHKETHGLQNAQRNTGHIELTKKHMSYRTHKESRKTQSLYMKQTQKYKKHIDSIEHTKKYTELIEHTTKHMAYRTQKESRRAQSLQNTQRNTWLIEHKKKVEKHRAYTRSKHKNTKNIQRVIEHTTFIEHISTRSLKRTHK